MVQTEDETQTVSNKVPLELAAVPEELWTAPGDETGLLNPAEAALTKTKGGSFISPGSTQMGNNFVTGG